MSIDHVDERIQQEVVQRIGDELAQRYEHYFPAQTIRDITTAAFEELSDKARVRTFLPTLAGRYAEEQIRAKAIAAGLMESDEPRILFVCPSNTGRSQIAAALMARKSGGAVAVRSGAGVNPGTQLHPLAVEALQEQGIDLSNLFPKRLTDDTHRAAELVVTMGCSEDIEHLPDTVYIDWDIPKLANKPMKEVREIIALIEEKTDELLARVNPTKAPVLEVVPNLSEPKVQAS